MLLQAHGELTGTAKLKTKTSSFWTQTSVSVKGPEDPADWPEAYIDRLVTLRPCKAAAKRDLKAGMDVPGVHLEETEGVRWR